MLIGYFDVSGEPDPVTGHLENLPIGGSFALFEVWQAVSAAWKVPQANEGVEMLHMADFEHYRGEFEWAVAEWGAQQTAASAISERSLGHYLRPCETSRRFRQRPGAG